jgi:hypothetical protein
MTVEILALIVSLCRITSVEDNKSNWTELKNVEKYQKECRVWYIDCFNKKTSQVSGTDQLQKCIKERLK